MSLEAILLSVALLMAPAVSSEPAWAQLLSPQLVQDRGAVNAELQLLVGARNTIVVVAEARGFWAFFADDIKSAKGQQLVLNKNSPVASSGAVGGLSEKDATREEIADVLLGHMRRLGSPNGGWDGGYFTAPGPGKRDVWVVLRRHTKGEQKIRVESVVRVEGK